MRQLLFLITLLSVSSCVCGQNHAVGRALTKDQAREDFMFFIDGVRESFPGLSKTLSDEELERYVARTLERIDSYPGDVSYRDFASIMRGAEARVHDSHLMFIWPEEARWGSKVPLVWIGSLDGSTLICTNAIVEHHPFIGREIAAVNGIPAENILVKLRAWVEENTTGYDGRVESVKDFNLALMCGDTGGLYASYPSGIEDFDMVIEFRDGEEIEVKGWDRADGDRPNMARDIFFYQGYVIEPDPNDPNTAHSYKLDDMMFSMLNDSVGYIRIPSFNPNNAVIFRGYIEELVENQVPNLIIDVRNNWGGYAQNDFFTHIARETLTAHSYAWVKKKSPGAFPELQPEEGHPGFLRRGPADTVRVHPTINYKGRIYMLANETSVSAATLFPAMLMKNGRGVVVGRETPTAYHYMNAYGFTRLELPNSKLTASFGTLETWFDIDTDGHIPLGRGVIPDYPLPLSLEELYSTGTDVMLEYTLGLIEQGRYLTYPTQ